MYSTLRSVQYLIAMLKAKAIKRCVISPGNSHNAIVRSIECDSFFVTYNIVDERSAAFFAIGLYQEIKEPIAICCTAGTAASNYLSGVTEAYRRNIPLVVITADKNPYYLHQSEDQMIDQPSIFKEVSKCSRTLPIIRDAKDEWYCNRILNEAFLEMDHNGKCHNHKNVPIEEGKLAIGTYFGATKLPNINIIERLDRYSCEENWRTKFESLRDKRVLIIYGQDDHISPEVSNYVSEVSNKYNCVVAVDKLSNLSCPGTLEISRAALCNRNVTNHKLFPDVVISVAGNTVLDFKFDLKNSKQEFEHWLVSEQGKVADPFKRLTAIFECPIKEFFEKMSIYAPESVTNHGYYQLWINENNRFVIPAYQYSHLYTVKTLMKHIPKNSILHLGNSTTIRIAQLFELDESVEVYCNRGVNGIDGCVSTFVGQACVTDKLCFLIVGDLTFFYDMNALWNRYLGSNVRIMLNNNGGAALFHFNQGLDRYPTLNLNVAAEHNGTAKGWAESRGFSYLAARTKAEFDMAIDEFVSPESKKPIFLEVFTSKEEDARLQHEFYAMNQRRPQGSEAIKVGLKKTVKSVLGEETISRLRRK